MHGVLTIMLASVFAVKASQLSIIADKNNVKDGERVVLTCTVPDFSDNLFVKQNSINKAVCIGSDPCTASNSEHNASRSGSTNVIFTILSFSKIRDEGQWLISYGNTESTPITLSAFTESPAVTVTEKSSASTSIDQNSSSNNPTTENSNIQKTETTIMTTTYNGITSTSLHVSSEVTTPMKTDSDNSIKLSDVEILAIVIPSGIMFVVMSGIFIVCCYRYRRRKDTNHTSKRSQENLKKNNGKRNHKVSKFRRNLSGFGYGINENNGSSKRVIHDNHQQTRKYDRVLIIPSIYASKYDECPQSQQSRTVNRNELYGINTPSLRVTQDNNKHKRWYNWGQPIQSPERLDNFECNLKCDKNNYNRRHVPDMLYVHVPHDPHGFFIYQGHNRVQERQFIQYYWPK